MSYRKVSPGFNVPIPRKLFFGTLEDFYMSANKKIIRLPGMKGFIRYNKFFVDNYIKSLQNYSAQVLHHSLPETVKRFLDQNTGRGQVPYATGNLRDSIVASVTYWPSYSEEPALAGSRTAMRTIATATTPHAPEDKPQKWGRSLGGLTGPTDSWSSGRKYYTGFGRDYAEAYIDGSYAKDGFEDFLKYDVRILLEATIPYAGVLNNNSSNPEAGWFTNLMDALADRVRAEVGIKVDEIKLGAGSLIGKNRDFGSGINLGISGKQFFVGYRFD